MRSPSWSLLPGSIVLASMMLLVGCSAGSGQSGAAAANGQEATSAGLETLPGVGGWLQVFSSPNPRVLFVEVEEITRDRTDFCWSYYRPSVSRTSHQITISLTGISEPEPSGLICAGGAIGTAVVRVELDAPYAGEQIIDGGTGRVRHLENAITPRARDIVNAP